jgi:cysteine dioxygenase
VTQLLIVWRPGGESRIHDHTQHCLMKMLRGALRETVFRFPDEALLRCGVSAPPAIERRRVLQENEVGYISSACIPWLFQGAVGLIGR